MKITFFDTERDILVKVNVSAADAQRAATDTGFAKEILKRVLNEKRQSSRSANLDEDNLNFSQTEYLDPEYLDNEVTGDPNSATQESEISVYRWSPPCVLLLLETYRSLENDFNGKLPQKRVWEKIATELNLKGYDVTGPQCSSKLRSLKKTYKSIKDQNCKSGTEQNRHDRRSWQFFDIMEDIFTKKASMIKDHVAVASSTGLLTKQFINYSMGGSNGGCSIKSNKTSIATLMRKRLRQKEKHEEQKMKRHKERMEMDEKFIKILEKLANK